jgi:hypothetical protein
MLKIIFKSCIISKEFFIYLQYGGKIMKKSIALALATIMSVTALTANVGATDYTKVNLLVEGKTVETDQPAVIVDSRTLVPVRVIAENLGSVVDWDADTKTVTFTYGNTVASMEIGGKKLNVTANGVASELPIDVPATIINSRTMVPVRFLSETFGYTVDWDAETKTVNVTSGTTAEDVVATPAAVEASTVEESTEVTTEETTEVATDASTEETTEAETATEETTETVETTTTAE